MKKLYAITVLLLAGISAGAQVTFMKHYGGGLDQAGYSIKECFDGGYIACGYHYNGVYHPYVLRIDSAGNVIWSKIFYGTPTYSVAFDIIQTADSGFLFTGYRGASSPQMRLMKLSPNGDSLWNRLIGTNQWGQAVVQTPDEGYMIAGSKLFRTDSNGILLWQNAWPNFQLMHITPTFDGGYATVGKTGNVIYLYKTDSAGTLSWTKILDGRLYNPVNNVIVQLHDSGYAIAGNSVVTNSQFLIRTDANGDTLWTRTFPGYYGTGVVEQSNGNIAVGGSDLLDNAMHLNVFDSLGTLLYTQAYGYVNDEWCQSIAATSDGGYILCGSTNTFSSVDFEMFIVKTDSTGFAIGVGIHENQAPQAGKLFPNPATSYSVLTLEEPASDATIELYDAGGKLVQTINNVNGTIVRIERNDLPAGVYFVKLISQDEEIIVQKIVFTE